MGRRHHSLALENLAFYNQTNIFAVSFHDKPRQCEFYNLDSEFIELERKKKVEELKMEKDIDQELHRERSMVEADQ